MEVLGIDIGFGFTKATNGKDTLIFKSLFGDATDLQFWMDFGEQSLTDFFHVTIDGKSYFIGDLAEQQSTVLNFTLDQEKLISEFVKILTLTVTGVFLKKESAINVPINIVSGLPISYFKHNQQRFNEILTGHHKIIYHQHDGAKVVKEIYINKIKMLPQPLGSILNLLMDDKGKIVNLDMAQQKIGVVDIVGEERIYLFTHNILLEMQLYLLRTVLEIRETGASMSSNALQSAHDRNRLQGLSKPPEITEHFGDGLSALTARRIRIHAVSDDPVQLLER